ncbi:hypothetical protein FIBSPDRAFT_878777, partial [Athelia psychrophila]
SKMLPYSLKTSRGTYLISISGDLQNFEHVRVRVRARSPPHPCPPCPMSGATPDGPLPPQPHTHDPDSSLVSFLPRSVSMRQPKLRAPAPALPPAAR